VAVVGTDISEELIALRSVLQLLDSANVGSSSPIPPTLMLEAMSSSETPVLKNPTWRHIPQDDIPHSKRSRN
jgi:hypothetical protein